MSSRTIVYDREPCRRCGGSGLYSWCEMHGSKCFGCGGTGQALTRAGKKAQRAVREFMAARYTVPAVGLKAGTQVRWVDGRWYTLVQDAAMQGQYLCLTARSLGMNLAPAGKIETRPTQEQFLGEVIPYALTLKGLTIQAKEPSP